MKISFILSLIALGLGGCAGEDAPEREPRRPMHDAPDTQVPAPEFTPNESGKPAFCEHDRDDAVRDMFCADEPPEITGLLDLQEALSVVPPAREGGDAPANPFSRAGQIIVLGHSTALSGHLVSPINPRVIMLGDVAILTFQRGVQRIEIAALDRKRLGNNFYLLSFEQACNDSEDGCSPGHLFTPQIESDWTRTAIRDDEELKNTQFDCRQCHQRSRENPKLLMRELESPWTHFFFPAEYINSQPGMSGSDLMRHYLAAKGDELYGGAAVETVSPIAPFTLQSLVGDDQPLLFDAPRIDNERWPYGPDGYADEIQPSPTWERAYDAFKRGEQLALPYLEQSPSDPDKQAALTDAYKRYRDREIGADELPDLADIFPDDPYVRAQIGLQTEPGASPEEALIQACGSCHNDVLDQNISRARFNIDLSRLPKTELERAIARIKLPRSAPGAMPPPEARQLDPEAKEALIEFLRSDRAHHSDERLVRAAEFGMAGGGRLD